MPCSSRDSAASPPWATARSLPAGFPRAKAWLVGSTWGTRGNKYRTIKARWNKHSSQHYHKMQENDRIKCRSDQYGTDKYWQRLQLELGPVNCQSRVSQNLGFEWLTGYWTSRLPCCALENLCETLSSKVHNLHQPASRLLVQDKRTWPLNWIVRSIIASIWFSESDIKNSSIIILIYIHIILSSMSYCWERPTAGGEWLLAQAGLDSGSASKVA